MPVPVCVPVPMPVPVCVPMPVPMPVCVPVPVPMPDKNRRPVFDREPHRHLTRTDHVF